MVDFDEELLEVMNNIGESRKVSDMLNEIIRSLRNVDARLANIEAKEAVRAEGMERWKGLMMQRVQELSAKVSTYCDIGVAQSSMGVQSSGGARMPGRSVFISVNEALAYVLHGMVGVSASTNCAGYFNCVPVQRTMYKSLSDTLLHNDMSTHPLVRPTRSDRSMVTISSVLGKYAGKAKVIEPIAEKEIVECIKGMDANVLNLLVTLIRRAKLCRLLLPVQAADAVAHISEELTSDNRLVYVTPTELLEGNSKFHKLHMTLLELKTGTRKEFCKMMCSLYDTDPHSATLERMQEVCCLVLED